MGPARCTVFRVVLAAAAVAVATLSPALAWPDGSSSRHSTLNILPVEQIKPGMKGVAYTIFAGETIEKMELEVIGVVPNMVGPKQDIIVVRLLGEKVQFTGVAGGMSGSPVYIDGKLVGALAYRFGIFAKEPLAGITPMANILEADSSEPVRRATAVSEPPPQRYEIPSDFARHAGMGEGLFMAPIETPLVFSGFERATLEAFGAQLKSHGLLATQGGTEPARPDDANIQAGDMVGMVLLRGDLNISAGCTVTAIVGNRVFVCGHPVLNYGTVEMPLVRGHVLTTLASSMASTKMMNTRGAIGTVRQDRWTSVIADLGAAPKLIPVELQLATPAGRKAFRFEMIENPKFTPLLVGIALFNGIIANPTYGEGLTLQLSGEIRIRGHSSVSLENMFVPTDQPIPDGFLVAASVQNIFSRIFTNPYEQPKIEQISLRVESIPERRWAAIENAWSEKSEVSPGENINIKVLLRPYRGPAFIQEVPITIPEQATRGNLRILVSDSDTLNRMSRFFSFSPQARLPGLEQLITLLNRERRNDRLYVTLLQPNPTLLVADKELPNAPMSQINVLDQRRSPGASLLLRESTAGEWSMPMNTVVSGQYSLQVTVR